MDRMLRMNSREHWVILDDWGRVFAFGPINILIVPDNNMAVPRKMSASASAPGITRNRKTRF